jgi:hypothetical protein
MPNYNRTGPEGKGPRTGRKLGKSNPENKGLSKEEIAQNNADQPEEGKGRGKRDGKGQGRQDGSGKGRGRRKFGRRKSGKNRRHRPANENDNKS